MVEARLPAEVLIVGGGVAALEAMMALRDLAGDRVHVTLVAPDADFVHRPWAVAEPFALGEARSFPLREIAADFAATPTSPPSSCWPAWRRSIAPVAGSCCAVATRSPTTRSC
jgi:hypothetical protein